MINFLKELMEKNENPFLPKIISYTDNDIPYNPFIHDLAGKDKIPFLFNSTRKHKPKKKI